jgi:hypothetical protein
MEPHLLVLTSAVLAVATVLGLVHLARLRVIRRVRAVAEAYAEREITQETTGRRPRTAT